MTPSIEAYLPLALVPVEDAGPHFLGLQRQLERLPAIGRIMILGQLGVKLLHVLRTVDPLDPTPGDPDSAGRGADLERDTIRG